MTRPCQLQGWLKGRNGTIHAVLLKHFLRQVLTGSDAEALVVRSLAGIAAPMLVVAFWIVTLTHGLRPWSLAGIHSLFVLYSFCAMGCVTTLSWEQLFPERLDFLVLLPLPLHSRAIFAAQLCAVGCFLALFLCAANVFGTLLLPALAGLQLPRAMAAHAAAVFGAGAASALAVFAVESLVVALVPRSWFRMTVPCVQTLLVAGFLFTFLQFPVVMQALPGLLSGGSGARWWVPLWFASLYEVGVGGSTATVAAHALAGRALLCLPVLLLAALAVYPAAWARQKRIALEGARSVPVRSDIFWKRVAHATVLRSPDRRAIFHFLGQTLARLSRYHARLAAYAGAGMALSAALILRVSLGGGKLHGSTSQTGAQATVPFVLFWTVAGLHTAFLLPTDLSARWIFRMADVSTQRVVSTAKLFVFLLCCAALACLLLVLAGLGEPAGELWRQWALGIGCAVLLVDLFFYLDAYVPFTRPSLTERSNLPMTLAVYVFGLPALVLLMVALQRWTGRGAWRVLVVCGAAAGLHVFLHWLRSLPSHPASDDAFLAEMTEEVQTLGLSR